MKKREVFKKLKESTLRKYRRSPLLGRFEDGTPFYFHSASCPGHCHYVCNGQKGYDIAFQIIVHEGVKI